MAFLASFLCLLMAAFGAVGVVSPPRIIGLVRKFQTPRGLLIAAGLRVVMGVAFIFAAPASRAPGLIFFLGVMVIVMGIFTPFFGVDRFRKLLDWWSAQGTLFVRVWGLLALGLGLLGAWAVLPTGG